MSLAESSFESLGEEKKGNPAFLKWYIRTREIMTMSSSGRKGS